jgi:DNA modification methylase
MRGQDGEGMKPYYEDSAVQIFHGDCRDILPSLPEVDLIFADPPFNVGKGYEGFVDKIDNYKEWCADWVEKGWNLLWKRGSFYFMTLTRYLEWQMPLMAQRGSFVNLIAWRNVSACHGKRAFWPEYQPIMIYAKSEDYVFNTYAQVDPNGMHRWGGYSTEYKGQFKDRWDDIPFVYAGSIRHGEAIMKFQTNEKAHPCQMPEGLARRAILFSTISMVNGESLVLDPFLGSGTT